MSITDDLMKAHLPIAEDQCEHGSVVCELCAYKRGVTDTLKVVENFWAEPNGFSELKERIMELFK